MECSASLNALQHVRLTLLNKQHQRLLEISATWFKNDVKCLFCNLRASFKYCQLSSIASNIIAIKLDLHRFRKRILRGRGYYSRVFWKRATMSYTLISLDPYYVWVCLKSTWTPAQRRYAWSAVHKSWTLRYLQVIKKFKPLFPDSYGIKSKWLKNF